MTNRVDDLRAWQIFITYAKTGSLSACAEILELEPSSVSRTIAALEKGIGQELVLHNSRPMQLTEVGIRAVKRIEPILRAHRKFLDTLASDSAALQGHIRLSVAPGFATRRLMPFLTEFANIYPKIDIDVVIGLKEHDIAMGRCDLGVLTGEPTLPDLVYMYRGRNVYLPVASPQYVSTRGMPIHPSDLREHTVYAYSGPVRQETKTLCRGNEEISLNLERVVRMADITTIRQAVLAGNGVGLDIPLVQIWEDLVAGRLVPVMPGWMRRPEDCFIVCSKDNWHFRRVRISQQWFAKRMKETFDGYEDAVAGIVGLPARKDCSSEDVFNTSVRKSSSKK